VAAFLAWAVVGAAQPTAPADSARAAPDTLGVPADTARAVRRPAEWDTVATGLPEEARLCYLVGFRYNRVDGPAPSAGLCVERDDDPQPILLAAYTHAFSRERGLFDVRMHERLGGWPRVALGGRVYRRTASKDEWIVGEVENTLFALFARTDYRDYYEAEGGRAYLAVDPGRDVGIKLEVRAEEQRSLRTRTRVSAFGKEDRFQPNPPIERGNDRGWTLTARIGPEKLPPRGGTQGEVSWERSGDPLTSDFDYGRLSAMFHTLQRLGPRLDFRARGFLGSTREGVLPPQELWQLGGIGTLRGHRYKEYSGDQFFLLNAEQYCRVRKRSLYVFGFLDYGAAWFGSGNWERQRPALDGGLGIRLAEGPLSFHVAKNLRDSGSPVLFGVRLGGSF
jgi:Omp85 superfamily domain